ncbi:hypothetical protein [Halorussus caseinilyticus]|uniref:DNA methylase N-4/N-6 domain-containing protein n=1 Tax=Halorussus caseinilyticus TaxID=3034025 RepID=A0ABD5WQS0_9EURY
MAEYTRQTTLDAPSGKIADLKDIDWTFEGADTQYLTHGLHSYPARMIPQIPRTLFDYYKSKGVLSEGDTVYDPFSGSGTTAVEGRLHGLNAEANDVNPLACLLTFAKSIPLPREEVETARRELLDGLAEELREVRSAYEDGTLELDELAVRDGWFPEPQQQELWHVRRRIDGIEAEYGEGIGRLLRVSLSASSVK